MLGWLTVRPFSRLLLAWIAAGVVLLGTAPLLARAGAGVAGSRFLAGLLGDGGLAGLSTESQAPARQEIALAGGWRADRWRPPGGPPYLPLVLVHGLTPDGKNDPRLAAAAGLLARTGFLVLVPELPGLRAQRLDADDTAVVAAALGEVARGPHVRAPAAIVAVSVGLQAAVTAAVQAPGSVRAVVSLGGFAEARALVRHFTTRPDADPAVARDFLLSNLDLVRDPQDRSAVQAALAGGPLPVTAGAEARAVLAVLENRDPARVEGLLAALPAETRALLDRLSPARYVGRLGTRLVLVHGRDDPAIPFTESVRLAAAADPRRTRLVLVDVLAHVEGRPRPWRQLRDLAAMWTVVYELLRA